MYYDALHALVHVTLMAVHHNVTYDYREGTEFHQQIGWWQILYPDKGWDTVSLYMSNS